MIIVLRSLKPTLVVWNKPEQEDSMKLIEKFENAIAAENERLQVSRIILPVSIIQFLLYLSWFFTYYSFTTYI